MISISAVGDISLGEHYFSFGHGPASILKEQNIFRNVVSELKRSDFIYGNLEGPISEEGLVEDDPESVVFRGRKEALGAIKESGFNILHVANNHILQHGEDAFNNCINNLIVSGVDPVGTKNDDVKYISKDDITIGIIAASMVPDNLYESQCLYQGFNYKEITNKIERAKSKADWIIVSLHWGLENRVAPTEEQIQLANDLKNCGVNIILGHHPHIFYEIDYQPKSNFLCAYSLGNFIFDLPWDKRMMQTGILRIELSKKTMSATVVPVLIGRNLTPYITGREIALSEDEVNHIYTHHRGMFYSFFRKFAYFFCNLHKGNTKLKISFFKDKILKRLLLRS